MSFETTSSGREEDHLWRAPLDSEMKALRDELETMKAKLEGLL